MKQARNETSVLLEKSWPESGTDTCPSGYNWQKHSGILTNFENQIEQSNLHSCHLIYIQVSIDSITLIERIPTVTELNTETNP